MTKLFLPAQVKPLTLLPPAADAAGRSSPFISLKHVGRAYLLLSLNQGNAATVQFSVLQAQDVSGTGSKPLALAVPVFSIDDTDATDLWMRQPDSVNFTSSAALKSKQVLISVDPALLDVNNGFDCIAVSTGASNAANVTAATALLTDLRYGDSKTSAKVN